jgi:parallel beta-helix repeat protein
VRRYLLLAFLCLPLSATVNVKDYGAQGDGVANDTSALNTAFSTACVSSDNVYIPAGTYLIDSLDTLHGCGVSFYGDGSDNSILKLRSATKPAIWTLIGTPAQALSIKDVALDGGHMTGAGLSIEQYQAVVISRVFLHDFGTPGYALGHKGNNDGLYVRNIENVRITDSRFTGNERAGVELQAVHSSIVQNSTMSYNGGMGGVSEQNFEGPLDGPLVAQWLDNTLVANGSGGIDVETDPKLPPAQGILQRNRVIDCGNDKWDSGWGLVIGLNAYGTIAGNWVANFAAHASAGEYTNAVVYVRNGGAIQIADNTIIGTKAHAILGLNGTFPVTISGNTLADNGTGIFIYQSSRVQIMNNIVTDSEGSGIDVFWSHGTTIAGNHLARNVRNLRIDGRSAIQRSSLKPVGRSVIGIED